MDNIKVLIADDHTIVRKGLCSLLRDEGDITVVGEAKNGREVLDTIDGLLPDVIVMDVNMPLLNGIEVTRHVKKAFPSTEIIILTMYSDEEYVHEALMAGASGFLLKDTIPQDLCTAIRTVFQGESFLSPSISKTVIHRYAKLGQHSEDDLEKKELTTREREIVQLIAEGYHNREISEALYISPKTVEVHKQNIQKKLDVYGTAELTKYAIKKGIIKLE
jgi:DNA-binding NarL/FixJ family response regulator